MKGDTPNKNQHHKSILKSDAISPAAGERKSVHFMVNEEAVTAAESAEALAAAAGEEHVDSEDANMEQLMAAAESAGNASASTPDKDSSTITIFNENSEVSWYNKGLKSQI